MAPSKPSRRRISAARMPASEAPTIVIDVRTGSAMVLHHRRERELDHVVDLPLAVRGAELLAADDVIAHGQDGQRGEALDDAERVQRSRFHLDAEDALGPQLLVDRTGVVEDV